MKWRALRPPPGKHAFTNAVMTKTVIIVGAGMTKTVLHAEDLRRFFTLKTGSRLVLKDLSLVSGAAADGDRRVSRHEQRLAAG